MDPAVGDRHLQLQTEAEELRHILVVASGIELLRDVDLSVHIDRVLHRQVTPDTGQIILGDHMTACIDHLIAERGELHLRISPRLPLPLETGALIVVGRGSIEGGLQCRPLCHVLVVAHAVAGKETACLVEGDDAVVID